jgi:propionyl-CoA carboxylase alpha chain
MGEQAVALAKAVNYDSAGTVEFVAGQDKSFYFLEMNTRLQVEHPVTELVTGIDLVEQMIRVAAGEKLSIAQKDVTLTGWAVESRVYAEDPFRNFLPSIGRLVKYRPPAEASQDGVTVRNDTGVQEGGEISIHYDPMIAKLVTHAPSRAAAIEAQATALDAFYVDGIRHNIPFLSALMNHPRWREGKLSTGFIAEEFPKGFSARPPEGEIARRLAAVGAAIDHVLGERKRQISGQLTGRLVQRERRRAVWLDRDEIGLDVAREADGIAVRFIGADGLPGNPHNLVSTWTPGEAVWQGTIDGHFVAMQVRAIPNGIRLAHQGFEVAVNVFTESEAAAARLMPVNSAADTGKKLLCPMPGLVVSIAVSEGQEVKSGETLAVVEAMKMQNVLRAERDGTVKKIHAAAGATLAVDALILEFA